MRLLLDTHIMLWWLDDNKVLSRHAKNLIDDPNHMIFVSIASIWEISIKKSLGKLKAPSNLKEVLLENNFEILPITIEHTNTLETLPDHHQDPFDRMLIAQASTDNITLMTHDKRFEEYSCEVVLV